MTLVSKYSTANSRYWGTRNQNGIVTVHPFTRLNEHQHADDEYIERDNVRDIDTDLDQVYFLRIIENLFDNFKALFYETNVGPLVRVEEDSLDVSASETTTSTCADDFKLSLLKLGHTSTQPDDATVDKTGNDVIPNESHVRSRPATLDASVTRRIINAITRIITHETRGPETGNEKSIPVDGKRELGAICDDDIEEDQGNASTVEDNIAVTPTTQRNYTNYISYVKNSLPSFSKCWPLFQRRLQNLIENLTVTEPLETSSTSSVPEPLPSSSIETIYTRTNYSNSISSLLSNTPVPPPKCHQQSPINTTDIVGGIDESSSRTSTWVADVVNMENQHRSVPNISTSSVKSDEKHNVSPPRSLGPPSVSGSETEGSGGCGELLLESDSSDCMWIPSSSSLSFTALRNFTSQDAWVVFKIWLVFLFAYTAYLLDIHNVTLFLIHVFILPDIELFATVVLIIFPVMFLLLLWRRGVSYKDMMVLYRNENK